MRPKTRAQLKEALKTRKSAFVSWLRAGHELRQEAKSYVTEVIEMLVNCQQDLLEKDKVASKESDEHPIATEQEMTAGQPEFGEYCQPSPIHKQIDDVTAESSQSRSNASPPQSSKSLYELQLEQSERAYQEALRVHEAQTSVYKWQQQQQKGVKNLNVEIAVLDAASTVASIFPPAFPPVARKTLNYSGERGEVYDGESYCFQIDNNINSVRAKVCSEGQRLQGIAAEQRRKHREVTERRMAVLREEQEQRRREWEQEDHDRLAVLEVQLQARKAERSGTSSQQNLEQLVQNQAVSALENASAEALMSLSLLSPESLSESMSLIVRNSSAVSAPALKDMRQTIQAQPELSSLFDQLEAEEQARKRQQRKRRALKVNLEARSHLSRDQYDGICSSLQQNFCENERAHESRMKQELRRRRNAQAIRVQKYIRRFLATCRVDQMRREKQQERVRSLAGGEIVRIARGRLGRRRFCRLIVEKEGNARRLYATTLIQTVFRGYTCRLAYRAMRQESKTRMLQRVYRGHRGRRSAWRLREEFEKRRSNDQNATKLQATWRMYVARNHFLTARFFELAAVEIQRVFRGLLGRRQAARKKQWHDAPPGAERLALGLQLIEGSKQAFERQQEELDMLHGAQEAAERQVLAVHKELREAEQELALLEHELHEIDQLDGDVLELTHEVERLHSGGVKGLLRNDHSSSLHISIGDRILKSPSSQDKEEPLYEIETEYAIALKKRQADIYAVEMALTTKRSERERKKRELEAEFAGAFAEVHRKREILAALEERLADMEQTRMQKDREFARLQRHLMELLEEQKLELDNLREKGVEIETATATSAAAAAATAAKAREHEERSQAMFESTEELMKFQFMSMSLSYFSSLNMLKNLRDINADTTASAITSTAETATTAAAAAAAANISPVTKALAKNTGEDAIRSLLPTVAQRKQQELTLQQSEENEALSLAKLRPLPEELRAWTVDDVSRWLDTLSLSQYKAAFREGAVDGDFLIELRAEDISEVLGVSHKLHVRKLLVARSKLLPLTAAERKQLEAMKYEVNAARARGQETTEESKVSIELSTVFSQARNGRIKRLVESLDAGFPINSEDDKGNTLLLLACQNVNQKMVEVLITRQANINHRNAQGNTPLHYAMTYDSEGILSEYLISHGADDTIENNSGLSPYDGLTAE